MVVTAVVVRVFVVLGPSDREAGRLPGVPSRPRSVWASLVPVARRRVNVRGAILDDQAPRPGL